MEPFIGQIMLFGGNFPPRGWAFCHGQELSIEDHQSLFSLLGTTYGGDGRTKFNLPDLRGRAAIGEGQGTGLSEYHLGQMGGAEAVTLSPNEIPAHSHNVLGLAGSGDSSEPTGRYLAESESDLYGASHDTTMAPTGQAGGSQPHSNMQPYLAMNYVIALVGVYPSRS